MFDDAKKLQEHLDATREQRDLLARDLLITANAIIRNGSDPASVAISMIGCGANILRDLVAPEHVAATLRQMADAADRLPPRPVEN